MYTEDSMSKFEYFNLYSIESDQCLLQQGLVKLIFRSIHLCRYDNVELIDLI